MTCGFISRERGARTSIRWRFSLCSRLRWCVRASHLFDDPDVRLTRLQIAGNVAKLPAEDLNSAAMSFLVARTLYIGLYMGIKNNGLALARTGVYAWSITIPTLVMWKAGRALQD